jgi:hypothetical protein
MVNGESVERACSVVSHFTDEQMADEFDRFFRAQPAVCEFVVEATHESGQKIQELSLFLSYMVFKAVEVSVPSGAGRITPHNIEEAYRETELWMTRILEFEDADLDAAVVHTLAGDREPFLVQYVIAELNEPLEDGTQLNEDEKGEVFFVLKTVIASFSGTGSGEAHRIIEP